ncbi:MAG: hypothetical protein AB7N91_07985 [Candidatus Tectimicrobiota bacterium]
MTRVEQGQMTPLAMTFRRVEAPAARLDACHQRHREHGTDTHQSKEALGEA